MKHLGSGNNYETYEKIQPELLDAFPRSENREKYKINKDPFTGYDVWNCYEFSTLLSNGTPIVGVLKIVYPAHSENIVESKSLKLYLNSYNNVCQEQDNVEDLQIFIEEKIKEDLSPILKCHIDCVLHIEDIMIGKPVIGNFRKLNVKQLKYLDNKLLNWFEYLDSTIMVYTDLLKSNCAKTNQPDWADLYIFLKGDKIAPDTSLLDYIVSFRNDSCFHETVVERIYDELNRVLSPKELMVTALYTRRGGIDINPIRVSDTKLLYKFTPNLLNPTVLTIKGIRH